MRINNKENAYYHITEEIKSAAHEYSKGYKDFLNHCKTERECTERIVSILKDHGFTELKHGQSVKPGDRVYRIHRLKSVYAAVVGSAPLSEGVNIAAAHIDNPRLDLKTNPLYEDQNAYFKRPITMEVSESITGLPSRSLFMELFILLMEPVLQ